MTHSWVSTFALRFNSSQGGLRGDRQIKPRAQIRYLDTGPRNDLPIVLVDSGRDAGWFEHRGVASLHRVRKVRSKDTITPAKRFSSDRRHSALLWSCLDAAFLLDNQGGLNSRSLLRFVLVGIALFFY